MSSILKNSFIYSVEIESRIDLYSKALEFFEFINGIKSGKLSEIEKKALIFYMMYGYSENTIADILSSSNINRNYIRTINSNLRDKGYLEKDIHNNHKSHITNTIAELRDYLEGEGPKLFTVVYSNGK